MNGQPRGIEAGATLADLLARLEMDPRRVAVERNLDVVPRKRYTETVLCDGDKLEIVTFVGGGA